MGREDGVLPEAAAARNESLGQLCHRPSRAMTSPSK